MEAEGRVLVLDTKDQAQVFKDFIGEQKGIRFFFADNIPEALQIIAEEKIEVVLVGCRLNGFTAEDLPDLIQKETKQKVQVVLNSFNSDTCNIKKQSFIRSNIFDIIWPTTQVEKIAKRIHVALEAQRLEEFGFVEGEER